MQISSTHRRPRIVLIGGPDVDARLPLMHELERDFEVAALGSTPELAPVFAEHGFQYRHYPLDRRVRPLADFRSVRALRRLLSELGPDLVHTFDTKPGVWGCIAARRAGVRAAICTVTGLGSLYAGSSLRTRALRAVYELLQRAASSRADVTVFQNHDDRDQLVAAKVVAAGKTEVILGSGVETGRYRRENVADADVARVRRELGLHPDATVVTMIARVTRSKGVLEFTAAARALRSLHPTAQFLLVGPDDDASLDRLTDQERSALRATVEWPGARRDIVAVLAASDVFVLPTAYREGIPRVLLEAASMGLPLVTTDSPGCNEVVEHGRNGLLIAAGDATALQDAIDRLLARPALRREFGAVSRRRAVELFDLSVVAAATRELYRRVLARGATPLSAPDPATGRR
jgi:glycosyltransferase involved in cell wall biosynthesis